MCKQKGNLSGKCAIFTFGHILPTDLGGIVDEVDDGYEVAIEPIAHSDEGLGRLLVAGKEEEHVGYDLTQIGDAGDVYGDLAHIRDDLEKGDVRPRFWFRDHLTPVLH